MKNTAVFLLVLFWVLAFFGCGNVWNPAMAEQEELTEQEELADGKGGSQFPMEDETSRSDDLNGEENSMDSENCNVLVAYFSATGTTGPLAEYAADILDADLYEIIPEQPYTQEDLAYYTNGRADREQNDASARPAISGSVENMAQYEVVFLGYPIWHGQAPRIISTFLESYDFSGKIIIPFCTSHSSGIGSSDKNLHSLAPGADWFSGRRFAEGTSRSEMEDWIGGLDLPKSTDNESAAGQFDLESRTVVLNSGYEMPVYGLGTYSLHGETCINAVKSALANGVRLIDTASAYGNDVICCEV